MVTQMYWTECYVIYLCVKVLLLLTVNKVNMNTTHIKCYGHCYMHTYITG